MNKLKKILQEWHFLHTWTNWTEIERAMAIRGPGATRDAGRSPFQQRICTVCGYKQEEAL